MRNRLGPHYPGPALYVSGCAKRFLYPTEMESRPRRRLTDGRALNQSDHEANRAIGHPPTGTALLS
jgi:hypothetical protein